ncbi:MMPL family transporter [Bacillus carboniphilus]|uniref:MMPL family transporter n=1 Tax=Bacillus carboniphilus TaxID=86663 RepID=A0ABY9JPR0_9BACI|nr:MMPL family transporter [Bacillus carboniphilus]WLR41366.1 MMPL family transporter [Bacillus carboniphilus]
MQDVYNELNNIYQKHNDELKKFNDKIAELKQKYVESQEKYKQLETGVKNLAEGLNKFQVGYYQLLEGFETIESNQGQLPSGTSKVGDGLSNLESGQSQFKSGLEDQLSESQQQAKELEEGLQKGSEGLSEISTGLTDAQVYLSSLADNSEDLYIPEEALGTEKFQELIDGYYSSDRKTVTMDVVLSINPFSKEALDLMAEIDEIVEDGMRGTALEGAEYGIGGNSSIFADLGKVSKSDFQRTSIFIFTGLFIVLVIMLRSIVAPIYLILGLVLCYYTSLGFSEFIFVDLLGYSGINWAVPFYGFVLLLALGIDYSIFLMYRFKEYGDLPIQEGILKAMTNMGTVIISAALILGGTFAAMYAANILSLMQIATIVITGLMLYALVILPFFVPVMVKLFGKANWWPFRKE